MTRLLTTGYETGDLNEAGVSSTNINSTQTVVNTNPTPRLGAYCLKCTVTGSGTNSTYKSFTFAANKTELWVRFAIYLSVTGVGPGTGSVFAVLNDSAGNPQTCLVWDSATSNILARQGGSTSGTLLGTSSAPLTQNVWHVVEWRVQITSATAGVVEVWLNGTQVINFSGDNTATATLNMLSLLVGQTNSFTVSGAGMFIAIDDLAVNDVSGTVNNGRPQDGRVVLLAPNGAGSSTQLTRGGTDTGANWSQVSEIPPSFAQYVGSPTVGQRDLYTLADVPGTVTGINVVELLLLAQNSDAGAGSVGPTLKSGATVSEGSAVALGTAATYVTNRWETDPNTGAAWTIAAVNALEAGATVR